MDQIAILNESLKIVSKKNYLEKDMSKTEAIGLSANRKVKITIKYALAKLRRFGNSHQREIYQGNVVRVSQCEPCQSDKMVRGEEVRHGGVKLLGDTVRSWRNFAWYTRVETVTSGKYNKTTFLRGIRCGHKVDGLKINM